METAKTNLPSSRGRSAYFLQATVATPRPCVFQTSPFPPKEKRRVSPHSSPPRRRLPVPLHRHVTTVQCIRTTGIALISNALPLLFSPTLPLLSHPFFHNHLPIGLPRHENSLKTPPPAASFSLEQSFGLPRLLRLLLGGGSGGGGGPPVQRSGVAADGCAHHCDHHDGAAAAATTATTPAPLHFEQDQSHPSSSTHRPEAVSSLGRLLLRRHPQRASSAVALPRSSPNRPGSFKAADTSSSFGGWGQQRRRRDRPRPLAGQDSAAVAASVAVPSAATAGPVAGTNVPHQRRRRISVAAGRRGRGKIPVV